MPRSAEEGKDWLRDHIVALRPKSILDVGAGAGRYAEILRPVLRDAGLIAIEVHAPYVEEFRLAEIYDLVIVGDVRDTLLPRADVIVLGDVLEHLPHDEALTLWQRAREAANLAVALSLPVYGYEQGTVNGNTHEAHLHQWSDDQVRAELDGIIHGMTWSIVGTYLAAPLPRPLP